MANIIVTGATGTIGRRVVEGLIDRGASPALLTRNPASAPGGAEVLPGSFEDADSLGRAFAGKDTVVLITPANARADEQAARAIDAAEAAGVRKLVRISALKADPDGPTDNTRQHGRTEAKLAATKLTTVILRPHFFMQNLFMALPTILAQGKIFFGVGDGKLGLVDTRDVSDAAVVAATTDTFDGGTFELTGPASVDYHAVAAAVGRALGREVGYVPVPPEAVAETVRSFGADDWTAGILRDYCAAYARGFGDFVTENVQRITGHAPRSIDDFAREVLAPASRSAA